MSKIVFALPIAVILAYYGGDARDFELPEPRGWASPLSQRPDDWLQQYELPSRASLQAFRGCYEARFPAKAPFENWPVRMPDRLQFQLLDHMLKGIDGPISFAAVSNLRVRRPPKWIVESPTKVSVHWGGGFDGIVLTMKRQHDESLRGTMIHWSDAGDDESVELPDLRRLPCAR